MNDYIPGEVKDYTYDFSLSANGNGLDVSMLWEPNEERTCHYKLYMYGNLDLDLIKSEVINMKNFSKNLYRYNLKELNFGMEYKVGIAAENVETRKTSLILWRSIKAPSCTDWFKNELSQCAKPRNVTVEFYRVAEYLYKFDIFWEHPTLNPDFYTIKISGLDSNATLLFQTLNGKINSIQSGLIEIVDSNFELQVTAHSVDSQSRTTLRGNLDDSKIYKPQSFWESYNLQVIGSVIASLLLIIALGLIIFIYKTCRHRKI